MTWEITLPYLTPTLNKLLRMHFRVRRRHLLQLAWDIRQQAIPPAQPLARAKITVIRHTTGTLDDDGLKSVCKGILDVLQPVSKRHPLGLGFIASDGPECIELQVQVVRSSPSKTFVRIGPR